MKGQRLLAFLMAFVGPDAFEELLADVDADAEKRRVSPAPHDASGSAAGDASSLPRGDASTSSTSDSSQLLDATRPPPRGAT